jgi:hypothetical protein
MHPDLSLALASERTADALRAGAIARRDVDVALSTRGLAQPHGISRYFRHAAEAYQQSLRRTHRRARRA